MSPQTQVITLFEKMVYNPRFPYTLKVLRAVMNENGEPVFDEDANPMYHIVLMDVAEYAEQMPKMTEQSVILPHLLASEDDVLIVTEDNKCLVVNEEQVKDRIPITRKRFVIPFGYRQQSANALTSGDAIVAEMKIACPLILGDIHTKDLLELTDKDRTFRAEVVKKINTNFGTNIWYNEVKQ